MNEFTLRNRISHWPVRDGRPARRVPSRRVADSTLVRTESGRVLLIPHDHSVFVPIADHCAGDRIDPATTDVRGCRAGTSLRVGLMLVIDNTVEVVAEVS